METNTESKLVACSCTAINKFLLGLLGAYGNGSFVRKEQFSNKRFVGICFGSKTCKVEEAEVDSGVYVDTVFGVVECKCKQWGEGNCQQLGCKNANLSLHGF